MSSEPPPFFDANNALNVTPSAAKKDASDQTSKNPFRHALARPSSSPDLLSSASQATQSSSVGRPRPARAVFHDLPTAHSSITSGTARSRQQAPLNTLSDAYEEEDSIPLQELRPLNTQGHRPPSPSFFQELPLPSSLVLAAHHRPGRQSSTSDFASAAENINYASKQHTQSREKGKRGATAVKGSSVYQTIPGATASSLPLSSATNQASHYNGSSRKHSHESNPASIPIPDLGSILAPRHTSPPVPRHSTKRNRNLSNTAFSLPEGSTVGNIYRHYARSDYFDDGGSVIEESSTDYDLEDDYPLPEHIMNNGYDPGLSLKPSTKDAPKESAINVRHQRRTERLNSRSQPPSSALPSLPGPSPCLLPSSSLGFGHSSSYGHTQNLLELAEHYPNSTNRSDSRGDGLHGRHGLEPGSSPPKGCSSTASYPQRLSRAPNIYISKANEEGNPYEDRRSNGENRGQCRQPLEREVSNALRRASKFSAYSDGSLETSLVENFRYFQSEAARKIEPGSGNGNSELSVADTNDGAQSNAFYDRNAIPAMWTSNNQQNMVRIPIQHHHRFPNPQPISARDDINHKIGESDSGEDANDWETVGGSGHAGSVNNCEDGVANQSGSSVVNTSDVGMTSSYIPEIREYGSTERIAQHPGNIEYSGDYRQRILKKTKMPVFLPVYGEHKVNGYLADSNRLRAPPSIFNHTPQPLERQHTNPFKSPPPTIVGKPSRDRYSSRRQGSLKPNHFPATPSMKTDWSDEENEFHGRPIGSTRLNRPGTTENFSRPFSSGWIDDFGYAIPDAANVKSGDFLKPISRVTEPADRPSSWGHVLAFAHGEGVEGYNADGTRTAESPFEHGILREHSFSGHPLAAVTADNFVGQKIHGPKHSLHGRDKTTLVRGPPGAFYSGLSKADLSQSAGDRPRKFKKSHKRFSTTEPHGLRALSLLQRYNRTITPSTQDVANFGPDPSLSSRQNDFVYRSPLAPPKRKTWQALYTKNQLTGFENSAKVDGNSDSGEFRTIALNDRALESGHSLSQDALSRHLGEEPRLWGGKQRQRAGNQFFQSPDQMQMDMPKRKKKISLIVLCLCNIVFPSLLLYHGGHLDWLMLWLTTAEFHSMGKPQKAQALWCFIGWCIAIFFGLVGFLIYWFAIR